MKKTIIFICAFLFISSTVMAIVVDYETETYGNDTKQTIIDDPEVNVEVGPIDNPSGNIKSQDLPIIPGAKGSIVILGAFATRKEPKLSTEEDSDCPIEDSIDLQYKFPTLQPFFIGIAIKNKSDDTKDVKVSFTITGPAIYRETSEITIPEGSTCLAFIDVIFFTPGLYKISGGVPFRGAAEMIVELSDEIPTPTPTPTLTPTPTPIPLISPSPTVTP